MYAYGYRPNPASRLPLALATVNGALGGLESILQAAQASVTLRATLALGAPILFLLSFLLVGFMTSRSTGEIKSGARAGLLTGLFGDLLSGSITILVVAIVPGAYLHITSATALPVHVTFQGVFRWLYIAAVVGVACGAILWMVVGFVVGALGGLIGRALYREPAAYSGYGQQGMRYTGAYLPYGADYGHPAYPYAQEPTSYPPTYVPSPATYEPPRYVPGPGAGSPPGYQADIGQQTESEWPTTWPPSPSPSQ